MSNPADIDGTIYHGDGIWRAIGEVEAIVFSRRRWAHRFEVSLFASVENDEFKATGRLRDIAAGGALFATSMRFNHKITSGESMTFRFKSPENRELITCSTIVRRIANRRTIWGRRMTFGLEFQNLDVETKKALDRLTDWLAEAEKIKQATAELLSDVTGHQR